MDMSPPSSPPAAALQSPNIGGPDETVHPPGCVGREEVRNSGPATGGLGGGGDVRRAGMTGAGQSEDRETPMGVAESRGSAAMLDPVEFVTAPVGDEPEPARLGGRAPFDDVTTVNPVSDTLAALEAKVVAMDRERESLRRALRFAHETCAVLRGALESCQQAGVGCSCGCSSIAMRVLRGTR